MNWFAFALGFCAGALLVLSLFYAYWVAEENERARAEFAAIWGAVDELEQLG